MNPWVMQKIGQMVGQQDRANTNMRDALKMWDTASKFEKTRYSGVNQQKKVMKELKKRYPRLSKGKTA